MATLIDTSLELIVERFRNGVKLTRPENLSKDYSSQENLHKIHRLGDLLDFKMNVHFVDTDSIIQNINQTTVETCGFFMDLKKAIGKTVYSVANKKTADNTINQDQQVITKNRLYIEEEFFERLIDNQINHALTIKLPWYDNNAKLIGVMGFSIGFDIHDIASSLLAVINTGLLSPEIFLSPERLLSSRQIHGAYLSKREFECLYFIRQGMTAKMIARRLNLSPRTIEFYVYNIKRKLNVNTRIELIEKIIESNFFN